MKRHIIITRILEFGGSNAYLKTLVRYFGKENVIIVLKKKEELIYVHKIDPGQTIPIIIIPGLRESVQFKKYSFTHNLKEIYYILKCFYRIFRLSARNSFAGVSISVIDPEKYLYFFWFPFIKVKYILHSEPRLLDDPITTLTCNLMLGNKKKIITVSNSNKKSILLNWKISKRNEQYVSVVYNCLDGNKKEDKNVLINSDARIILTMGHVAYYKNPDVWLDVAKRVIAMKYDVCFFWLGNGPLLETFKQQTQGLSKINFTGLIENPDLYLKKAHIYYQPSLIETQGIAVIEAMSNHLPCVVSNVGGLPESIENNKSGFVVEATNANEHVNSIVELLNNKDLCKSFGEYSYKRYNELFIFDMFRKKMDKIYDVNPVE